MSGRERGMQVFRHYSGLEKAARGAVVAVGNFDGLHLGHRAVIAAALKAARDLRAPSAVLTFEPHPRAFFQPDIAPFRLTPFRTKARHIEALGVDILYVLHFDAAFSRITAPDFVRRVLVDGLAVRHLVVGEGFAFGHRRAGTVALLREMAGSDGFGLTVVPPVAAPDGAVYSSTRIREHLAAGHPERAAELLGREWEIEGRVEPGERRGHAIGFPTANLSLGEYLVPATGVYAVRAGLDRPTDAGVETVWYDGVANLGHRPTFGGDGLVLEVHIFDFTGDIYGRHLRVALAAHLRPERRFDGVEALKAQIAEDCARARAVLAGRAGARERPAGPSPASDEAPGKGADKAADKRVSG